MIRTKSIGIILMRNRVKSVSAGMPFGGVACLGKFDERESRTFLGNVPKQPYSIRKPLSWLEKGSTSLTKMHTQPLYNGDQQLAEAISASTPAGIKMGVWHPDRSAKGEHFRMQRPLMI
jgi:hypothetical protein